MVGAAPVVVPYRPPPVVAPAPFHLECHQFGAASSPTPMRSKTYDFAPMALSPVRRGPRTRDRPRVGIGRMTHDLRALFAARSDEVINCWKFASSRGARATSLEVGVTIDPLGNTSDLRVTSQRAQDDALIACVTESLTGASYTGTATRAIRLGATLDFTLADQPAWPRLWPKVAHRAHADERAGSVCTPVIDDGATTQVRLPRPLVVSDFDPSRTPPPPPGSRRAVVPEVRIGCTMVTVEADKRTIRTAVMSNYGAFQTCYADAFARDPALAGEVRLQTNFRRGGAASNPRVTSGAGDPQLHSCLVAAMQELWIAPGPSEDGGLEVNLTFTLSPPPTPLAPTTDPVTMLAAGDPEGALAAWTAILNRPHAHSTDCSARAGVVNAIAALAPWLDDPRMRAAIQDLADAAALLPADAAKTCVAAVAQVIAGLTRLRGQPRFGPALTHEALERYTTALPLAPFLDDGALLRWFYADALLLTPHAAEGVTILKNLTWDPTVGGGVADELATRDRQIEQIFDSCGD
jgi:hypothetical protein